MKQIRVIAFVVASIAAVAPFAGAQGASRANRVHAGARAERGALLRGLNLGAAEKSRVKSVHAKYASETKPMRESLKSAKQEARADRQKGDTAAARAVLARTKGNRESLRAVKARERNEIRSALLPANQRQFDANVQQAVAARGKKGKGGGGRRGKISNG